MAALGPFCAEWSLFCRKLQAGEEDGEYEKVEKESDREKKTRNDARLETSKSETAFARGTNHLFHGTFKNIFRDTTYTCVINHWAWAATTKII